jgi:hypothetical protein
MVQTQAPPNSTLWSVRPLSICRARFSWSLYIWPAQNASTPASERYLDSKISQPAKLSNLWFAPGLLVDSSAILDENSTSLDTCLSTLKPQIYKPITSAFAITAPAVVILTIDLSQMMLLHSELLLDVVRNGSSPPPGKQIDVYGSFSLPLPCQARCDAFEYALLRPSRASRSTWHHSLDLSPPPPRESFPLLLSNLIS